MKLKYLARLGLIGFYTFAAAITTNLPASASIIRKVAASQVTGETAQLQTVKVWNGHGVSISFYRTGEIIKKIWLDDPSKFVFDVDGCLEGLGRCSQKSTGAGLIHIRRIEKVKIPGLPQATHGAHMTVITESGSTRKSYHFRIVPGSGKPEYSQIEIIGDTPSKPQEVKKEFRIQNTSVRINQCGIQTPHLEAPPNFQFNRGLKPVYSSTRNYKFNSDSCILTPEFSPVKPKVSYTALSDSRYISRGMQVALSNQWVTRDSKLWQRLNQLVELRSLGEELVVAANNAGVSMQLVEKLMLMGGKRLIEEFRSQNSGVRINQ